MNIWSPNSEAVLTRDWNRESANKVANRNQGKGLSWIYSHLFCSHFCCKGDRGKQEEFAQKAVILWWYSTCSHLSVATIVDNLFRQWETGLLCKIRSMYVAPYAQERTLATPEKYLMISVTQRNRCTVYLGYKQRKDKEARRRIPRAAAARCRSETLNAPHLTRSWIIALWKQHSRWSNFFAFSEANK